MTIINFFTLAAIVYALPDFLMILRSVVVYFIQTRIQNRVFKIADSILTNSDHVEPFVDNLRAVYWDFDKMMKHWWVFDINKMRN